MLRGTVLEVLAPLIAVLLVPLFYWRILTPDTKDVATFPIGDFTELNYPFRRWVAEELARGQAPWWNPFVFAGQSAIGDIQFRVLYPPDNLLARFIGGGFPVRAFEWDIIGHVALGVLFTYLLARRLTGSRLGGLVAGIVFGFGGFLSGFPIQQANLLDASIWLPLILLCIDVGVDLGMLTAFVVGAGAFALSALAGHPQSLFYVGLGSFLYLLFKGWNQGRIRWVAVPGIPILFLGGLALAAAALIPAYLHLGLTDRTDVSYAYTSTGFAFHEALGLVLPLQLGAAPLYCGVFTLLLVAIALASARCRTNKLFWLGLAILSLILSFGGNTFLQVISYLALGSFKFRQHERIVFLFSLAVAMLAGYGVAELTASRDLRLGWLRRAIRWPVAALVGFGLASAIAYAGLSGSARDQLLGLIDRTVFTAVVFGLGAALIFARDRRFLKPTVAGVLAVALVALDLFSTNWQTSLRPGTPQALLAPSPIATYLEENTTGLYRIASEGLLPGDGNAGALFRLQDVVGNSPLETEAYADFIKTVPEWTRWQVLNVRYIITKRKFDDPRLQLLRQDGGDNLYELDAKDQLPRAYVVHRTVDAPDHQLALDLVKTIDLHTTAVVEGTVPNLDSAAPNHSVVQITSYEADSLALTARLDAPGLLIVSEADYPGWQAEVDGRRVPVLRADGFIRAIPLGAGTHQVRFWFVPPGLQAGERTEGVAKEILAAIVVVEAFVWGVRRTRRRAPRDG